MVNESTIGVLSGLCSSSQGVFRGQDAVRIGIRGKRLDHLGAAGIIERVLPDTSRMTVVQQSNEQSLKAALLWAGPNAAAAGMSAGTQHRFEGVRDLKPEIMIAGSSRIRSDSVIVHHVAHSEFAFPGE